MDEFEMLMERLGRQDFDEAASHFKQAQSARDRAEWEAANSQLRSAIESMFNNIAILLLGSSKSGGGARKELEAKGHLAVEDARLVQSFFGMASGGGSHAGSSSEDECRGRFLSAMGIAYIGLKMVPELVRVQDVFTAAAIKSDDGWSPRDWQMCTNCSVCGTEQNLNLAPIARDGVDTVYSCKHGCSRLVIVGPAVDGAPWPGRGSRLGAYLVRFPQPIRITAPNGRIMVMSGGSSAFMKSRPDGEAAG